MLKKLSYLVSGVVLSINLSFADHDGYDFHRTFLDMNDTLGGIVEGDIGRWQNSPHGVVVAPDGNVWVNIYAGSGRQEILANGDTVHFKGIYVLDPVTGDHVSYSPIEILTFPDGSTDSLIAESATSGGGRGIALDADGHILSSHYKTLYKINYMTGEGVAMYVGESSLTEAAADDNGNIFLSYVLAAELPVVTLDPDLNFVANAMDTVGHINRALVVTGDGENMLLGSTWNGIGFLHFNSSVPGVIQHTIVDTFGVFYGIGANYDHIGSAMGADSAYIAWLDDSEPDTTFDTTSLWVSALDLSPDESTLLVGTLTAGWGGPLGGANWLFDMDDLSAPYDIVGNWHDWEGTGEGVTDGPRGGFWDEDGNLYLSDFYSNAIFHYAYYEDEDGLDEPFSYHRTFLDMNDTLGGIVEGDIGRWQNSPHGVVVAPDGNVWVNIYAGSGRQEILANGDTVHFKGIYVLDPVTGDHVSYSPIEILTFPDGSTDSLIAESATSGGGRGIALDADGHILSSHYKTLYKINYMTGEGVAMYVGESSLTEAAADDNGNIFLSYVLAAELPVVTLDPDLNFVANAMDTVGHINRSLVVTGDGENMLLGSTWNGIGFLHFNSSVPGVMQHTIVDTFGVFTDIPVCMEEINSAMGADSAYVFWCDDPADTTYSETSLWVSALDLSPDESTLIRNAYSRLGRTLSGAKLAF